MVKFTVSAILALGMTCVSSFTLNAFTSTPTSVQSANGSSSTSLKMSDGSDGVMNKYSR